MRELDDAAKLWNISQILSLLALTQDVAGSTSTED